MTQALFDNALAAARAMHADTPAIRDFVPWPDDLRFAGRDARVLPSVSHVRSAPGAPSAQTRPLHDALIAVAPHAEWRHTYTEAEVGADFLARFGWFELAGPAGHFRSRQTRITVGYWGPGLHYDWHEHPPEELYSVVSGSALFLAEGEASVTLGPGGTRFHKSNQRHAMITDQSPILTLVYWRGDALDHDPRMSR